jgi:cytochrome c oxidase subunit IV
MTAATETHTEHDHSHDDHAQHGMSNAGYIRIALILAAMTALEVSTYYVDFGALFMPVLIILMVVKFFIVVSYFMHLKFDNKLFLRRTFSSGHGVRHRPCNVQVLCGITSRAEAS